MVDIIIAFIARHGYDVNEVLISDLLRHDTRAALGRRLNNIINH